MPVSTSYPGVYVEELPSGQRSIVGVATSVTAFVGRTRRGSVDDLIVCHSFADFERQCGGLWAPSELGHAVAQFFGAGGSHAIISRVATGATTAALAIDATDGGADFALAAANPGLWGSALRVTVSHGTTGELDATPDDDTFHLTILEVDPVRDAAAIAMPNGTAEEIARRNAALAAAVIVTESFVSVNVDPSAPRWIGRILEQQSNLVRLVAASADRPIEVTREPFGAAANDGAPSVADQTTAVQRLDEADVLNLVCIPPPTTTTDVGLAVWSEALALCQRRRAILLVDPPAGWTTAAAAASLAGGYDALRSPNAAYYWPRVEMSDALQQGRTRPFVPCGVVAGTIARIDASRGVWKAPAGIEAVLPGVRRVALDVTDADSGTVNERGVNALRQMPPTGAVVWGARTARGADTLVSEWKYLSVRRLALYIEESLFRGTQWAVFEPNDAPLWGQMRAAVGAFMQDLFRKGAFAGAKASDAYYVQCDASTTTEGDRERGIVNVVIGFAPLRPSEFVVLQFKQFAGQ